MQSSGRGIVVDDTRWPFVRVVYTTFTDAEHQEHFRLLRAMLHEHPEEPFVVRVDLRNAQNLNAGQRRNTVEFWKNISPLIEGRFLALAYVATNPLIRGVIKAVSWFQRPPAPMNTLSSLNDADDWLKQMFEMHSNNVQASN